MQASLQHHTHPVTVPGNNTVGYQIVAVILGRAVLREDDDVLMDTIDILKEVIIIPSSYSSEDLKQWAEEIYH